MVADSHKRITETLTLYPSCRRWRRRRRRKARIFGSNSQPRRRRLWLLSSVSIDGRSLLQNSIVPRKRHDEWLIDTYTHIISIHPGPFRSCAFDFSFWQGRPQIIHRLLETLTLKGIQRLGLNCFGSFQQKDSFVLPRCVLQCESLLDLELLGPTIPESLPERIFPNLTPLKIVATDFKRHTLSDLLLRCSITELEISACIGIEHVCFESGSLEILEVNEPHDHITERLVIKDAPKLEGSTLNDNFTRYCEVSVVNAPKLEVLHRVDTGMLKFQLGESQFDCFTQAIKFRRFSTRMHSVQTLGIKVNFNYIYQGKTIPYFLRCFPCLETLNVLIDYTDYNIDDDLNPDILLVMAIIGNNLSTLTV